VTILETERSYVNVLLGSYDVPEVAAPPLRTSCQDFLRKFSRYNFAEYCLGLLFTNRLFKVAGRAEHLRPAGPGAGALLAREPPGRRGGGHLPAAGQVGHRLGQPVLARWPGGQVARWPGGQVAR
jgi:hypothetical protein